MNVRRDVFQSLVAPARKVILVLLASQTMTAGAIASKFDTARPTVSKLLQILKGCELLEQVQKAGKFTITCIQKKMKEVADFI